MYDVQGSHAQAALSVHQMAKALRNTTHGVHLTFIVSQTVIWNLLVSI